MTHLVTRPRHSLDSKLQPGRHLGRRNVGLVLSPSLLSESCVEGLQGRSTPRGLEMYQINRKQSQETSWETWSPFHLSFLNSSNDRETVTVLAFVEWGWG